MVKLKLTIDYSVNSLTNDIYYCSPCKYVSTLLNVTSTPLTAANLLTYLYLLLENILNDSCLLLRRLSKLKPTEVPYISLQFENRMSLSSLVITFSEETPTWNKFTPNKSLRLNFRRMHEVWNFFTNYTLP